MRNRTTTTPLETGRRDRRRRWGNALARVLTALAAYRLSLRAAARRAGTPRTAHRLRRLARRGRASTRRLQRATSEYVPVGEPWIKPDPDVDVPGLTADTSEIGALGSCMRANRRVYITTERALDARPPGPVADKLEALKQQTATEAGTLNARIGELCVLASGPEQR